MTDRDRHLSSKDNASSAQKRFEKSRQCKHVPVALLKKHYSSNCPGTLPVSILIDPNPFQLNFGHFKIVHFGHFMKNYINSHVFVGLVITATTPQHHRIDSDSL